MPQTHLCVQEVKLQKIQDDVAYQDKKSNEIKESLTFLSRLIVTTLIASLGACLGIIISLMKG